MKEEELDFNFKDDNGLIIIAVIVIVVGTIFLIFACS